MESESDTDMPSEDECTDSSRSSSSALSAEMLAMLEPDDSGETCRARARTSSTLFWLSHDATLPLVEDEGSPAQTEAPARSACTHSDGVQGHALLDAAAGFARTGLQEAYMHSFMPVYMG
eukprot:716596-Amphidinium_carterae.1